MNRLLEMINTKRWGGAGSAHRKTVSTSVSGDIQFSEIICNPVDWRDPTPLLVGRRVEI